MFSLLHLFCSVDDFCRAFLPLWSARQLPRSVDERKRRCRSARLSESEIMTIVIAFHRSHFRDFKTFYLVQVRQTWRGEFPRAVSYNRFIELIPRTLVPLAAYLHSLRGTCSGISFLDSTALSVCDNHRINQHKVFAGVAQRGKTSTGWFFGFKLHLVVNDCCDLLNLRLTPGNVDDRNPVPDLLAGMRGGRQGKFFADKGYISQALFDRLFEQDAELITRPKKNMKARLLSVTDALLLRKRALIESIIDQLVHACVNSRTSARSSTPATEPVPASSGTSSPHSSLTATSPKSPPSTLETNEPSPLALKPNSRYASKCKVKIAPRARELSCNVSKCQRKSPPRVRGGCPAMIRNETGIPPLTRAKARRMKK